MTEELIRAKVARVLNTTDLALNKGSAAGVEVGMRFAILSDKGENITDPDTNEVLDSVDIAKTLVKIVSVTEKLAVGRTFRSTENTRSISSMFAMTESQRHETLRTDERRLQQELDPKDSFIKIGDAAIQYVGDYSGIVYAF